MKDDRKRQPIKDDYLLALGAATSCFAICEWNAVCCSDKIEPGSLQIIVKEEFTAGQIAKLFKNLTRNMPPSKEREGLKDAAACFADLVVLRNQIAHGKPCTGPNGEARLSSSTVLEIDHLEETADSFSACSIKLNDLLYNFLMHYKPPVKKIIPKPHPCICKF